MLAEYTITERISEADGLALYRGRRDAGEPVLLQLLIARASPRDVIRFEHELDLAGRMASRAAVKPLTMTSVQGKVALVLEYFAGRPLASIAVEPLEVSRLLHIAIGICGALAELHRVIVHRDLNPDHVLVDGVTGEIKLIGFGIASATASERQALEPPPLLEGSLAYISPEQTRRTNHPIDSRSDLYSLGVILYQLATGAVPFHGRDLLDWVHCHLARTAVAPQVVVPGFPSVLSDVIMKLLAKSPDERYQTAGGLRADLVRCMEAYSATGTIAPFPLASRDISNRFEISARLFGRRKEAAALGGAFGRVARSGAPGVFLIAGLAGAGKTALVRELYEPVVSTRAFFATGKCDQYSRQTPYRVISDACESLVKQVLTRTERERAAWRTRLAEAVGLHGRLVTERVPALVLLIGEQPGVIELPVTQAESRFFQVFWSFLMAFASAEHQLVLFFDDLQWADTASLDLLEHVLEDPDTRHLLVVGAYRPTDVGPEHPLTDVVDSLRRHAIDVEEVALGGLSVAELDQLLRETLHHPAGDTAELAALVHERTAGNPFYTHEFLTALYREGLFELDPATGTWRWDIDRIRAQPATANVVELMLKRLAELPAVPLELVQLGAFVGGRLGVSRLAAIAHRDADEVRRDLDELVRQGLLVRAPGGYEFIHDRVQQAAYALVPHADRAALHRRIGWELVGSSQDTDLSDVIFEVASHLTRGAPAIANDQERRRVAAFDLAAGRRARAGAAYTLACEHLAAGISLLDARSWTDDYDTTFALHFELAQCRYLTAEPADAERISSELFTRARTRTELAALHQLKIEIAWMQDDLETAVTAVLACLHLFDVDLERHPSSETAAGLFERATSALRQRRIEELAELPPSSSAEIDQLLVALSTALPSAYWYDANLHFSLSSLAVRLAIEHGLSPAAAHAFADFGMIIGARLGRYDEGYRFGRVALDLAQRTGYENVKSRVSMVFAGMTVHWTQPLNNRTLLETAFSSGLELGDLAHASIACVLLLEHLLSSARLDAAHERAQEFRRFLVKTKFFAMLEVVDCESQLIESLRGRGASATADWWRDTADAGARFGHAPCEIAKLQAAVLFGDEERAAELAFGLASRIEEIRGYWRVADYHFLAALALAARYRNASGDEQARFRVQLERHRDRYAEWTKLCPENFLSRHALIRAEIAALSGAELEAIESYEQAIAAARNAGSLPDAAIAYERAARFYRGRGMVLFADTYVREARACYRQWGAEGKVRWLDARHPQLAEAPSDVAAAVTVETVDVTALATALRAISSEVDRPRLLTAVIRVVMQQAGADRGVLIRVAGAEWIPEVEAVLAGEELVVRTAPPTGEDRIAVPVSVVQRIASVARAIVLLDASTQLTDDGDGAYAAARQPRSVLCVPVIHRGVVAGALYLEHHHLRGAFSPDAVHTTELLASQVAISLENADLYGALLTENTQRRSAEEALASSRAHLESVLDHIVDGVIACDAAGRITLANRACEHLTGLARSELEATRVTHAAGRLQLGPTESEPFSETELPMRRALAGDTCVDVPATFVHARTGARGFLRVSSAPIVGSHGEVAGAVSILHDVTANAQLELLKDQFIRVAAHELKTPITIIRMATDLLSHTPTMQPALVAERVEVLERGVARIHRIVDALVLMSVLQSGPVELVVEAVDLAGLLSDVVGEVARTDRRTVHLRTEPGVVRGDRERLEFVFGELLDNAIKYSPRGEAVDVELVCRSGMAVVSVRDHGIGIPSDKQTRIFERFFRAHTDTAYDVGGMGVSLYLAKEITLAHGGRIWFESAEGVGTTFFVSFPLAASDTKSQMPSPGPG